MSTTTAFDTQDRTVREDFVNSTSNSSGVVHDHDGEPLCTEAGLIRWLFLPQGNNETKASGATALANSPGIPDEPVRKTELDEALLIVREFGHLSEGRNGSPVPGPDLIEDALVVLQNWPVSDTIPEPAISPDGHIALELYDPDGFTLGGIEVIGGRNAVFSIVNQTEVLCTGSFDTTSQTEIIKALSKFRHHLE